MRNDTITFAVDPTVAPELALAAAGLAEGLREAGQECEALIDPWPETVAGRSRVIDVGEFDHAHDHWRLEIGPRFDLELIDPSERSREVAFALPTLPARRPGTSRILLIGGDAGRRTRMISKTLEALRQHDGCVAIVWRPLPDEVLRHRFRGEVHPDPRGDELARLIASAAALLDVSDEVTAEGMLLASIGRASGVPTVLHEQFGAGRWEGTKLVSEWSGEAFAEAAARAARLPRNGEGAAAVRRAGAETVAGAFS